MSLTEKLIKLIRGGESTSCPSVLDFSLFCIGDGRLSIVSRKTSSRQNPIDTAPSSKKLEGMTQWNFSQRLARIFNLMNRFCVESSFGDHCLAAYFFYKALVFTFPVFALLFQFSKNQRIQNFWKFLNIHSCDFFLEKLFRMT